ncbi:MAG TPA: hypothetical protein VFB22_06475 [Candidatus Baltobacteraceae bacterium]|nr:hypothetical protein [Candidatus Baltobacteraceae bacterium]
MPDSAAPPVRNAGPAEAVALPFIAVIAESHGNAFTGALVRDAATGAPLAVTTTAHVPALRCSDFMAGEQMDARIVHALIGHRLLVYADPGEEHVPVAIVPRNALSPRWAPAWRVNPSLRGTPLLFVVGEISAREIYQTIPAFAQVVSPYAAAALAALPAFDATARVEPASLEGVIAAKTAPLFAALRLLRSWGLGPLALHSISPCTADDARFRAELKVDSRALTRTTVIMLFNDVLRAFCEREGCVFVDRWSDLTENGRAREGVLLDAVHARPELMRESLALLYARTLGAESGSASAA